MIEYDREFLVPYLQDICAYHLAERKLDIKIAKLEQNLRKCQIGEYNPKPGKKAEHTVVLPGLLVSIVFIFLYIYRLDFQCFITYLFNAFIHCLKNSAQMSINIFLKRMNKNRI